MFFSFVALTYLYFGTILRRAAAASRQAAPRYIEAHFSQWLEGRGRQDVAQQDSISKKGSTGLHEVTRSKRNFSLLHMRNTISEAADNR